jgi:hypothetical protein
MTVGAKSSRGKIYSHCTQLHFIDLLNVLVGQRGLEVVSCLIYLTYES